MPPPSTPISRSRWRPRGQYKYLNTVAIAAARVMAHLPLRDAEELVLALVVPQEVVEAGGVAPRVISTASMHPVTIATTKSSAHL